MQPQAAMKKKSWLEINNSAWTQTAPAANRWYVNSLARSRRIAAALNIKLEVETNGLTLLSSRSRLSSSKTHHIS